MPKVDEVALINAFQMVFREKQLNRADNGSVHHSADLPVLANMARDGLPNLDELISRT